ncbi:MAG: hypothetical protein QOF80_2520 [Verrucomicrobiota bacterium]|jgi:hypothetical protein
MPLRLHAAIQELLHAVGVLLTAPTDITFFQRVAVRQPRQRPSLNFEVQHLLGLKEAVIAGEMESRLNI